MKNNILIACTFVARPETRACPCASMLPIIVIYLSFFFICRLSASLDSCWLRQCDFFAGRSQGTRHSYRFRVTTTRMVAFHLCEPFGMGKWRRRRRVPIATSQNKTEMHLGNKTTNRMREQEEKTR